MGTEKKEARAKRRHVLQRVTSSHCWSALPATTRRAEKSFKRSRMRRDFPSNPWVALRNFGPISAKSGAADVLARAQKRLKPSFQGTLSARGFAKKATLRLHISTSKRYPQASESTFEPQNYATFGQSSAQESEFVSVPEALKRAEIPPRLNSQNLCGAIVLERFIEETITESNKKYEDEMRRS